MKKVLAFALLGLASCGSCGKSDDTTKPAATAEPSASTSAAVNAADGSAPKAFGKHVRTRAMIVGTAGMIFQTARGLPDLKDEQKTKLEKAEEPLDAKNAGEERKALGSDLSAGVKAGKLDQAKIDADLAAIDKAMKDRHEKEAQALNDAHAALEPAQRTAVVAKIKERIAAREAHMPDGGGRPPGAEAFGPKKRLERMTKDLELDADQQKKVDALAKNDTKTPPPDIRAENKKRTDALLAAFEKDGFDAKKLDLGDTKMARAMADEEVKLVSGLVPLLKPEQRDKLATKMERMDMRGPARGHGAGHGRPGMGGGDDIEEEDTAEP